MKKLLALVLAVLMVVTVFAGCAAKEESSSQQQSSSAANNDQSQSDNAGSKEHYKFGYSPMTMNNPFFVYIEECARKVVEGNGDEMVTADPQYDISKQIAQIEDMVSSGIDVLLLNPYDNKGIRPALDACEKANVPIVNFDADVYDNTMVESILISNNFEAGRLVGEKVVKDFPDGAKIAILDSPIAKSATDRVDGFKKALEDAGGEGKGFKVVYQQDGKGSTQDSLPLAENALQANPDLNVFFACNDPSAMGCVAALEAANKKDVEVFGIDGSPEGKSAIKEGRMHGTGAQSPKAIAEQSVEVAYKILKGETVEHDIKVDVFLIDSSNVDEYGTDSWQ